MKLGAWLNKKVKGSFRLVSVSAVNTVLAQADTSLTDAKTKALGVSESLQLSASVAQVEADKLATKARLERAKSKTIQNALDEIDNAEGM